MNRIFKLILSVLFIWNSPVIKAQTIDIYPLDVDGSCSPQNRPGTFLVPKTAAAGQDFLDNGIQYNSIRLISIENALNHWTVNSIPSMMNVLEGMKPEILLVNQRCDKLFLPIMKMPLWLSSSSDQSAIPGASDQSWKMFHAVPPSNYTLWQTLMDSIVSKINDQWGLNPYYEIWNEPDIFYWQGTPGQYFEFFNQTYHGLKDNHPNAKVGGPSVSAFNSVFNSALPQGTITTNQFDQTIIANVVDSCVAWNTPLDFIAWHKFDPVARSLSSEKQFLTQKLISSGHGTIPMMVTEWNDTYSLRDSYFSAAYMANYALNLAKYSIDGSVVAAWQDFDSSTVEFHQDYGMLSYGALHKPAWKALRLVEKLKGNQLDSNFPDTNNLSVSVAGNVDTLRILVSNYHLPPVYESILHVYSQGFNSQDFFNEGFTSEQELDSIFAGLITIPGSTALTQTFNNTIPVYQYHKNILLNGRMIDLNLHGLTGVHSGRMYVIDSTHNNVVFRYDSLITAGYTRAQAVNFLQADNTFSWEPITVTDSLYSFDLQANGVVLIELYQVPLEVAQLNKENASFTIYPNPTNAELNVLFPEATFDLEVIDLTGKIVFKRKNILENVIIDTHQFEEGIYHLRLVTEQGVHHQKSFVKVR